MLGWQSPDPQFAGRKFAKVVGKEAGAAPPAFEGLPQPSPAWIASTSGVTWDVPIFTNGLVDAVVTAVSVVAAKKVDKAIEHVSGSPQNVLSGIVKSTTTQAGYVGMSAEQPREFELVVEIVKDALGRAVVGPLVYSTTLSKPVTSPIMLDSVVSIKQAKFAGGNGTSEKLNANAALLTSARAFTRRKYHPFRIANVTAEPWFSIKPVDGGAVLTIKTLPANYWMGCFFRFDVKSFLDLAGKFEAAL